MSKRKRHGWHSSHTRQIPMELAVMHPLFPLHTVMAAVLKGKKNPNPNDYTTHWNVTWPVKFFLCSESLCVTTQPIHSVTVAHDVCCLFRCSGKSPGSSCWLLSSASSSWDWLLVSLLHWFQLSFTVYVNQCSVFLSLFTWHVCSRCSIYDYPFQPWI